jgi:DnaK suppressor protein
MIDKDKLRETLLQEKARLQQDLAELDKELESAQEERSGSPFGKKDEEAAEVVEMQDRVALDTKLKEMIARVDSALDKLEQGTYGQCDVCHGPISPERLGALPTARLCVKCKTAQDKAGVRR